MKTNRHIKSLRNPEIKIRNDILYTEYMKLSIPETSKMVKSLENKGYIIWKLDEKKERTYLVLTNKAIELSNCQKEKMIEAYEKIISNIQEDELAVTRCTLRKIRKLMEEIK